MRGVGVRRALGFGEDILEGKEFFCVAGSFSKKVADADFVHALTDESGDDGFLLLGSARAFAGTIGSAAGNFENFQQEATAEFAVRDGIRSWSTLKPK